MGNTMSELYAEDLNYWKTGQSSPDVWMEKTAKEIERAGGRVLGSAWAQDDTGRAAFMLQFNMGDDVFKLVWPVLESKSGNLKAARIQAATMMYHDVKARCVAAKVLGARASFMAFLLLPDGRTAAQASTPELAAALPRLLLTAGE